jgi:hypothetical protein
VRIQTFLIARLLPGIDVRSTENGPERATGDGACIAPALVKIPAEFALALAGVDPCIAGRLIGDRGVAIDGFDIFYFAFARSMVIDMPLKLLDLICIRDRIEPKAERPLALEKPAEPIQRGNVGGFERSRTSVVTSIEPSDCFAVRVTIPRVTRWNRFGFPSPSKHHNTSRLCGRDVLLVSNEPRPSFEFRCPPR